MLVFDTDTLSRRDRRAAMAAAMNEAALSSQVTFQEPDADVHLRMHRWRFGSMDLVRTDTSGITISRTRRQVAADSAPVITVGVMGAQGGAQVQDGVVVPLTRRTVYGIEVTRPYEHASVGNTKAWTVIARAEDVGLPLELVSRARARMDASPLRGLFLRHLRMLAHEADRIVDVPAAAAIEPATLHLIRAVLSSATYDDEYVREAMADTLVSRVKFYIREHLQDHQLNAATLAGAHHVSRRQLYKVLAADGVRLESWILTRRLEAARSDLARPTSRQASISATAAKWGFSNASHFTHRFRATYGMTPRHWQQMNKPDKTA